MIKRFWRPSGQKPAATSIESMLFIHGKKKYSKFPFLLCFLPAGWSGMKETFGTQVHLCTSGLPESDK